VVLSTGLKKCKMEGFGLSNMFVGTLLLKCIEAK